MSARKARIVFALSLPLDLGLLMLAHYLEGMFR